MNSIDQNTLKKFLGELASALLAKTASLKPTVPF